MAVQHTSKMPDYAVTIQVLMEAGFEVLQDNARSRHRARWAADLGNVIAVVVGVPDRVQTGASILPSDLIACRRLLRTDRRPAAKLLVHKIRTAKFQRWARAA